MTLRKGCDQPSNKAIGGDLWVDGRSRSDSTNQLLSLKSGWSTSHPCQPSILALQPCAVRSLWWWQEEKNTAVNMEKTPCIWIRKTPFVEYSRSDGHWDPTVVYCQQSAFPLAFTSAAICQYHICLVGYETGNEPRSVLPSSVADLLWLCQSQSLGAKVKKLNLLEIWHQECWSPSSLL